MGDVKCLKWFTYGTVGLLIFVLAASISIGLARAQGANPNPIFATIEKVREIVNQSIDETTVPLFERLNLVEGRINDTIADVEGIQSRVTESQSEIGDFADSVASLELLLSLPKPIS